MWVIKVLAHKITGLACRGFISFENLPSFNTGVMRQVLVLGIPESCEVAFTMLQKKARVYVLHVSCRVHHGNVCSVARTLPRRAADVTFRPLPALFDGGSLEQVKCFCFVCLTQSVFLDTVYSCIRYGTAVLITDTSEAFLDFSLFLPLARPVMK